MNSIDELAYENVVIASGIKVFVVTKSSGAVKLPRGWTHINAGHLTQELISKHINDVTSRSAFISGPPTMIDGVKKQLQLLKVKSIKTDYFIGY